jgi:hypothetical protein
LENIGVIIFLAVIAFFLWKIAFKKPLLISSNGKEWITLVTLDKLDEVPDDYAGPVIVNFYPIICWDFSNMNPAPITPFFNIEDWLKADPRKIKYLRYGYWLTDGSDYGIGYENVVGAMTLYHTHFWLEMSEYASSGYECVIEGSIPDCYQKRFLELLEVSKNNRANNESISQTDT